MDISVSSTNAINRCKIGANIARQRLISGMNQKVFSKYIGITPGKLGKIERGESVITEELAKKIAEALKVPLDIFFQ